MKQKIITLLKTILQYTAVFFVIDFIADLIVNSGKVHPLEDLKRCFIFTLVIVLVMELKRIIRKKH